MGKKKQKPVDVSLIKEYGELKVEIKRQMKRLAEIEKEVDIEAYVLEAGRETTDKSTALVLGSAKFTLTRTQGKPSLDEEAALLLVQRSYPKLAKTLVKQVPELDTTAFTAAAAAETISKADFKSVVIPGKTGTRLLVEEASDGNEQPLG